MFGVRISLPYTEVSESEVIEHDHDDIWPLLLRRLSLRTIAITITRSTGFHIAFTWLPGFSPDPLYHREIRIATRSSW